jgi:hypothetical protein
MSNQFLKLRRSAVAGKIPETSSLDLGELAINTFDGQLFLKKSGSQGELVTVVGSTGSFTGSFFGNGAGLTSIPASGITGLNLSRIATGSITASVSNTDISASFRVTSGSNTLFNVTKDGRTWIGAGTFVDAAYQLDIQGTSRTFAKFTVGGTRVFDNRLTIINDGNQGTISISEYLQNETTLVKHWIRSFGNGLTFLKVGGAATNMTFVVGTDSGVTNYDGITINDFTGNLTSSSAINFFTQGRGFDARYTARISSTNNVELPYVTAYPDLRFWTGNTSESPILVEAMRLDSYQALLIGTTGSVSSSILTLGSTTRGFLPTRTNSTASIISPVQGLLTYITASGDVEGLWQYRTGSNGWVQFLHNSSSIPASSVVGLNLSRISTGSITASVNTDISASFRLTSGSNTLLNVTREGFVWIGNGSFTNQAYQLDVQGTLRTTGDFQFGSSVYAGSVVGFKQTTSPSVGSAYYYMYGAGNLQRTGVQIEHRSDATGLMVGTTTNNISLSGVGSPTMRFNGGPLRVSFTSGANYLVGNIAVVALPTNTNTFTIATSVQDYHDFSYLTPGSYFIGGNSGILNNNVQNYFFGGGKDNAGNTKAARNVTFYATFPDNFTNSDGGNFTITGGRGTGTGSAGDVIFSTANITGSGTALQALSDRWWVKGLTGTLSNISNPPSASLYVSGTFILNGTEFNNTSSVTSAGITTISQLSTSSYTSCFYNYTVASASNARSGQVMTVWNGNTIRYTEVVTTDIGDTSLVSVSASLSSGFVRLQVSASSGWTFKNISNLL